MIVEKAGWGAPGGKTGMTHPFAFPMRVCRPPSLFLPLSVGMADVRDILGLARKGADRADQRTLTSSAVSGRHETAQPSGAAPAASDDVDHRELSSRGTRRASTAPQRPKGISREVYQLFVSSSRDRGLMAQVAQELAQAGTASGAVASRHVFGMPTRPVAKSVVQTVLSGAVDAISASSRLLPTPSEPQANSTLSEPGAPRSQVRVGGPPSFPEQRMRFYENDFGQQDELTTGFASVVVRPSDTAGRSPPSRLLPNHGPGPQAVEADLALSHDARLSQSTIQRMKHFPACRWLLAPCPQKPVIQHWVREDSLFPGMAASAAAVPAASGGSRTAVVGRNPYLRYDRHAPVLGLAPEERSMWPDNPLFPDADQTEVLLKLCKKFDCRWQIIDDRYPDALRHPSTMHVMEDASPGSPATTGISVEDMKARFLEIQKAVLEGFRATPSFSRVADAQGWLAVSFSPEEHKERRRLAHAFENRTAEQIVAVAEVHRRLKEIEEVKALRAQESERKKRKMQRAAEAEQRRAGVSKLALAEHGGVVELGPLRTTARPFVGPGVYSMMGRVMEPCASSAAGHAKMLEKFAELLSQHERLALRWLGADRIEDVSLMAVQVFRPSAASDRILEQFGSLRRDVLELSEISKLIAKRKAAISQLARSLPAGAATVFATAAEPSVGTAGLAAGAPGIVSERKKTTEYPLLARSKRGRPGRGRFLVGSQAGPAAGARSATVTTEQVPQEVAAAAVDFAAVADVQTQPSRRHAWLQLDGGELEDSLSDEECGFDEWPDGDGGSESDVPERARGHDFLSEHAAGHPVGQLLLPSDSASHAAAEPAAGPSVGPGPWPRLHCGWRLRPLRLSGGSRLLRSGDDDSVLMDLLRQTLR